jgi:nucleoside-diphosphate-sugar epimerase
LIPTDAPLEPTQTYPTSKAAASVAWAGFAREKSVSVSILRIFQVYGEGEPIGRLWPSIRMAAISGKDYSMTLGEQVRDFIPVQEVARQFANALKTPAPPGQPMIVHVGTGKPKTVAAFAFEIWHEYHAKGQLRIGTLPYRENEVMRFVPKVD